MKKIISEYDHRLISNYILHPNTGEVRDKTDRITLGVLGCDLFYIEDLLKLRYKAASSSLPQEDKPNSYKEYKKITGPVKPFSEWAKDQEDTISVSEEIDIAVSLKRIVDDSENVEDLIGKLKSEGYRIVKIKP